MSTLSVLDQVIDLSLVPGTVSDQSQTISTPITSNTPKSTPCPSSKNNSANVDVPDEGTTSTTAEPIVVLPTSSAKVTPSTPESTSEAHATNILPETTDEVITNVVSKENYLFADLYIIDGPSSSVSTSTDSVSFEVNQLSYGKHGNLAWKELNKSFQITSFKSLPLKIQHLDVGLPGVYVTGIIDISQHKKMAKAFGTAMMAVPHKKAKPMESDILSYDWLVKRPDSVASKYRFLRFRPTHMKENLVKGGRKIHFKIV